MPILGVLAAVLLALQFVPLGANYPSLQALVADSATTGLVAVTEAATMLCLALLYRRLLWAQLAGSVAAVLGIVVLMPSWSALLHGVLPAQDAVAALRTVVGLAAILTGLAAWCVALRPILPAWRAVRRPLLAALALLGPLSAYGSLGGLFDGEHLAIPPAAWLALTLGGLYTLLQAYRADPQRFRSAADGWAEWCLLAAIGLSLLVMLGWLLQSAALVRAGTRQVPMQFNTALATAFTAVALLRVGERRDWRVLAALCAFPVLVAVLGLAQELGSLSTGFDQWFITHRITAEPVPPGRAAPSTSVALLLLCATTMIEVLGHRRPTARLLAWGCGLLAMTIGALTIAGYSLGLSRVLAWGRVTPMSLHTAIACALMGLGVVLRGLRHGQLYSLRATLLPALTVVVVAAAATELWLALSHALLQQEARRNEDILARAADEFGHSLQERDYMLQATVRALGETALAPQQALPLLSEFPWAHYPGMRALLWLDADGQVLAARQRPNVDPALLDQGRALLQQRELAPGVLYALDGSNSLLLQRGPGRTLLAIIDVPRMQATALGYFGLKDLVRIDMLGAEAPPAAASEVATSRELEALGRRWRISFDDPRGVVVGRVSEAPRLTLLGGLLVAGLLAMALRFALLSRGQSLALAQRGADLRMRNSLLRQLAGGQGPEGILQSLASQLSEQWPDGCLALQLDERVEIRAWPAELDAAECLREARAEGDTHGGGESALQAYAQRHGLRPQLQPVRGTDGRCHGAFLLLRPLDAATEDDAAQLAAAAEVASVALARHAEQADVRDLQRTYGSLVAFHPDAVLQLDEGGRVLTGNIATQNVFGVSANDLVGRPLEGLIDPQQRAVLGLRLDAVMQGLPQFAELRSGGADAMSPRQLELTLVPVRQRDQVTGAFAIVRDVTRLRAADQALRQSHERMQLFSNRLIDLNECGVSLASATDRAQAASLLGEALRRAVNAGAVLVRPYSPAGGQLVQALREPALAPPEAAASWYARLGEHEPVCLDLQTLRRRLGDADLPGDAALPRVNWIAIPLRDGRAHPLGLLELYDTRPEDNIEDVLALAMQFAELGMASFERLRLLEGVHSAEKLLVRHLAFSDALSGSIGDAVYAVDRAGNLTFLNRACEALFGWPAKIAKGRAVERQLLPPGNEGPAAQALAAAATVRVDEAFLLRRDGARLPVEYTASPLTIDGELAGAVVVVRDISEKQRARALQRERDRFFELSSELFCIADTQGNFRQVNDAFGVTLGYSASRLLEHPWIELVHPEDRANTLMAAESLYQTGVLANLHNRYQCSDGSYRWLEWNARLDDDGNVYAVARDITERRRIESELSFHATHDALTGLVNLNQLQAYLQARLAGAAQHGGRVYVLYVDVDHFHAVNETRGYGVGDTALREIALRLGEFAGSTGLASRVAGDEFVVVLDDESGAADQDEIGDALRTRVEAPIIADGQQLFLTCSIGVSCFPDNATLPSDLIHQSEAAMLRAKREGRNTVMAFSNDQRELLVDRQKLGARLRDAVRNGELVLHYQPQVSVHNWQVCSVEALVRWQSPELGLLLPGRFIQVAEDMGQIVEMGQWVLETACRQAREWLDGGVADFTVAVNVSGLQLQRPDFLDRVRRALDASRLPPRYLELELTESIIMEHVERVIQTMRALKSLGVLISLDDFGSGYSSLSYLRRFPIDKLKIDQSFVRDTTSDAGAAGICRAIIGLGHQLGLTVSAEGVETVGQAGFLRRAECDQFQGNYFGQPLPVAQTFEVLRRRYFNNERLAPIIEESRAAPRTLLLVDDEENVLRALVRLLRRDSYQILVATRPREALELLASNPVQVILSDQRMPDQSGTEFLSQVKDMYPDTVRLILSGYSDLASLTDAINRGAISRYIAKPWDDEDLRRQIRDAFRMYEAKQAARGTGTGD